LLVVESLTMAKELAAALRFKTSLIGIAAVI
jgi:hypothetical protein